MAWNLNNNSNEYQLFKDQTAEVIDMYGLGIQYVKSENQNIDKIFGEFTHKKLTHDGVLNNIMVLPENSEDFDMLGNTFSKFGFIQTEMFNCYISSNTAEKIGYENFRVEAVGDIIVLPNNKKFEITFVEHEVQGNNNMFPYSNQKNVYMLKAKIWNYNGDEKEEGVIVTDEEGNESLDDKLENFNFTSIDTLFNIPETEPEEPTTEEPVVAETKEDVKEESVKINIQKPSPFGDWD